MSLVKSAEPASTVSTVQPDIRMRSTTAFTVTVTVAVAVRLAEFLIVYFVSRVSLRAAWSVPLTIFTLTSCSG